MRTTMMMMTTILCQAISVLAVTQSPRGIVGKKAPELTSVLWVANVAEETPAIRENAVTYLFFFQSWCPGCHSHGFPTLKTLQSQFKDEVNFIAVQTVFEGFSTNTPAKAAQDVASFDLHIPVGHDGKQGHPSQLLRQYRGGGTPWTIIIDKRGVVRFNAFHLDPKDGRKLITELLAEPSYEILPPQRGGQDLIGATLDLSSFGETNAKLTLYRWWTDTCPYCEASLPALDTLRTQYEKRGLRVVGVYHPKPRTKKVSEKMVRAAAIERNFYGDVVIDNNWSQLRKWWLSTGRRSATSVSVLVDEGGIVRFVHPGPVLFPSEDKEFAQENDDFQLLNKAIDALLPAEAPKSPASHDLSGSSGE